MQVVKLKGKLFKLRRCALKLHLKTDKSDPWHKRQVNHEVANTTAEVPRKASDRVKMRNPTKQCQINQKPRKDEEICKILKR